MYNDFLHNAHNARQRRRQLERKTNNSDLEVHLQMLKQLKPAVVHIMNSAKSRFFQEKLTTADRKETIRIIYSVMNYNAGTHRVLMIRPLPTILYTSSITKLKRSDSVWTSQIPVTILPRQTWTNRYLNLDPLRFRHGKGLTRSYK